VKSPRRAFLPPSSRSVREIGAVVKTWGGRIPVALVYPNRYATGIANLGFQFVYELLNQQEDVVCERAFLPEDWLRGEKARGSILTLESQTPLRRFEIVAFSVPFENDFPHVPAVLSLSGIPPYASRRSPPHPLVWVGGVTTSLNPEPLAPFVDLFAVGDAEVLLPDILDIYRRCRRTRRSKGETLAELSQVEGVYIPSLYRVTYDRQGRIRSFRPKENAPERVRRRLARNLSEGVPASRILSRESAFDSMFLVEIGRGCPRRCRFCAAGHVLRPTRHRRFEDLAPVIRDGLSKRERIGLVSSSVCDHPHLHRLCRFILEAGGKVSVSSLRLDALDDELLEVLAQSGHRSLAIAPEAGSQRLRDILGKGITEEQILEAVGRIARAGIPRLRMYFMVGLPWERWQDVEAIEELVRRILHRCRQELKGKEFERVTLSINPFVPKPFTPFQWHPFEEVSELKSRIRHLQRVFRRDRRILLLHEPPKWARIQALLSRGDRRVGRVVGLVAQGTPWDKALREVNLNVEFYTRRHRTLEEILPWDFIDHGFSKEDLWTDYEQARRIAQAD